MIKHLSILILAFISVRANANQCSSLFHSNSSAALHWTLEKNNFPDFSKITPKILLEAAKSDAKKQAEIINSIKRTKAKPTFENTILPLEIHKGEVSGTSGLIDLFSTSLNNEQFQMVESEISSIKKSEWVDTELFKRVDVVYKNKSSLDADQQRLVESYRKKFLKNGLNLNKEEKDRFSKIKSEITKLKNLFAENIRKSRAALKVPVSNSEDLKGLSEIEISKLEQNAKDAGESGYLFTSNQSQYDSAMVSLENRDLRKKLYTAFGKLASSGPNSNTEILKRIVLLRNEMAKILGYKNFSEYALEDTMAKNIDVVNKFIKEAVHLFKKQALKDDAELREFIKSKTGSEKFEAWDEAYWANLYKIEKLSFNPENLKPYFELHRVQNGAFGIAEKLYGIKVKERKDLPRPLPEMQVFEVRDKHNQLLAYLLIDPFSRSTKNSGAWMNELRAEYKVGNTRVIPTINLAMNYTKPVNGEPVLLSLNEARVTFHEFGHALHGMVTQARFVSQSGTYVATDFVELPSQLMEHFLYQKDSLKMFARHYKTNEPISDEMIENVIKERNFRISANRLQQLQYAMIDLSWYSGLTKNDSSVYDVEQAATKSTQIIPNTARVERSPWFNHIFVLNYGSTYYSYRWAEILDAHAFAVFKKDGIFNPDTAQRFFNLLEAGGSKDPMDLYIEFTGEAPNINAIKEKYDF